jgi:hypothetical protein
VWWGNHFFFWLNSQSIWVLRVLNPVEHCLSFNWIENTLRDTDMICAQVNHSRRRWICVPQGMTYFFLLIFYFGYLFHIWNINTISKSTFHFLNINQIRNCRVSNIKTFRPVLVHKMYLTQFLITSAETTVLLLHNRDRDVWTF